MENENVLKVEVQDTLQKRLRMKQITDENRTVTETRVYSHNTYRSYLQHLLTFVEYCEKEHNCTNLAECEQYAWEWMDTRLGLSPYTQKLEVSALRKIYGTTIALPETARRHRADIKRSRNKGNSKRDFSTKNNADLISFCRSTGLKRNELENLYGNQLILNDREYFLKIPGRSGEVRYAPVIGDVHLVIEKCNKALMSGRKVWMVVPDSADIFNYRRDYCHFLYDMYARDLEYLPMKDRYYCQGERKGTVFDRMAMLTVCEALGISKIDGLATTYLI